jgi:catechol 2,3-dioxygenase-like lactoylglutathione lyase family enzyme
MAANVRYIVDDVDACLDFYTNTLGFELVMHPAPGFAVVERDGLTLLMNAPGAGGAGMAGGMPQPGGWNRFQIQVDDLDSELARLRDAGVETRGDLVEGRGGRQVIIEDPSGNPIELFQQTGE